MASNWKEHHAAKLVDKWDSAIASETKKKERDEVSAEERKRRLDEYMTNAPDAKRLDSLERWALDGTITNLRHEGKGVYSWNEGGTRQTYKATPTAEKRARR